MPNRTPDDVTYARPATLRDVAEACGVSITAVSLTLRGCPTRFSEETKARIRETAVTLGYDPERSQGARRLVMRRFKQYVLNHLVAVCLPAEFYRAQYYTTAFKGIVDVLNEQGFGVLIIDAGNPTARLFPPILQRGDVDGMITLLGAGDYRRIEEQLRATPSFRQRPIVSLLTALPGVTPVLADAAAGAKAEVAHLLALGHRHFLYFRQPQGVPVGVHQDQLYPGYRQACLEAGLDPEAHLIPAEIDPALLRFAFMADNVQQITLLNALQPGLPALPAASWSRYRRLLRQHPQITAILAPNDATAITLRYHLALDGKRVPEDYSLVGFDDTDPLLDAHGQTNTLTTVRLPLRTLGQKAARLLVEQLNGKHAKPQRIIVPTKLIVRTSTAPVQASARGLPPR